MSMHRPFVHRHRLVRLLASCVFLITPLLTHQPTHAGAADTGVTTLTGTLDTSFWSAADPNAGDRMVLTDLTAFVQRNPSLTVDVDTQVLGPIAEDDAGNQIFTLSLPAAPRGHVNDLDHDAVTGAGVQIFSLELASGDNRSPFMEANEFQGWSYGDSSLRTMESTGEVTGGAVIIWAPDDEQAVSTGFGEDGLLFTEDDPTARVSTGWTVLNLEQEPFLRIRGATTTIQIVSGFTGLTDYMDLDPLSAFRLLVDDLEARYPYTAEKGIDWDALRHTYLPLIEAAARQEDDDAYLAALHAFALEFHDGHVSSDLPASTSDAEVSGFIGFTLALTNSGTLIVQHVLPNSPAARAGIVVGATVESWNDLAPVAALAAEPMLISESTSYGQLADQVTLLSFGPAGRSVPVVLRSPDGSRLDQRFTFELAYDDPASFAQLEMLETGAVPGQLPVTSQVLDSGYGYIRIASFYEDRVLMHAQFETALETLLEYGVRGLILDVRGNPGGWGDLALDFAGSFYTRAFTLANDVMLHPDGMATSAPLVVTPAAVQWDASPIAVLIDHNCASACELFVAAMAHDEDHALVGYSPTDGVLAGVCTWMLPGFSTFDASCVGVEQDGVPLLEGKGQLPTVFVAATAANLLNPDDTLLQAAVTELDARGYQP